MPVLPPEPAVFPVGLFDEAEFSAGSERHWHVMYTRPRQEKSLARELFRSRIPFYLPLIRRRLRLRGRAITSHVPLFPGYVFVFADLPEWGTALGTGRIVRPLHVPEQGSFWSNLRQIDQLICSGAPITPEDQFARGMKVVIRSGPLTGMEGVILRTSSGRRLVVQVDFIQRGASVLLDDIDLVVAN